ncbi:MAG: hypothetical protein ACYTDV_04670 [Planctomycetota bacterium]
MQQLCRYDEIPAVVHGLPDLDKPCWDKDFHEKLDRMTRQTVDPMHYISVPTEKK